ncbi:hypothetical protein BH23CHL7_BH23CHL7_16710 [soil metagenome]
MLCRVSRFWRTAYRVQYRILAIIDPLVRAVWRRLGVGNVIDFEVAQRAGEGTRTRLLGLLRVGDRWYIGHPNGAVGWTRDLETAGEGTIRWHDGTSAAVHARRLDPGDERDVAIGATGQHPFPGNVMYRLGRRHIRAVGVFFRLER